MTSDRPRHLLSLIIFWGRKKCSRYLGGSEGNVLGVEIRDEHTKEDKEDVEELKKIFEGSIAEGHDRVNFLFKIDKPSTWAGQGPCPGLKDPYSESFPWEKGLCAGR